MQKKLTIQDIARLAGVSKATVSRVLNRNPAVNAETSERVMRIVQEYDFVPNVTATGLAGGKTRLVGVLAPPLVWAGISEMLLGVAGYIEHTPYEIVLYSISFSRNHTDILDRILSMRMISGLLAILPGALSRHLTERFHKGLPLVMIDDQEKPVDIPWVGIDNVAGASTATRHLLELGHRRIAYIQGPQNYICAVERYQGYIQTLQQAGITPDPALVFQGRFDTMSGRECASALFALERTAWPSAIFAANDQMAYGVLEVAEERGIRVPEDVSLIGFDDNPLSSHLRPALTTIRQPFSEMGYKAIEQLLTMIDPNHRLVSGHKDADAMLAIDRFSHIHMDAAQRIQLPTSLVVRASTAAPQKEAARSSPMPQENPSSQ
ncbi:MAG TPA: LacI family DNA-binding transcriptional regulator [Ktedonosporobacter sp.]|jgi:LacI family transcriptional regulator|nr:LacI family DNA-binding transcriptional regulator [Ktedonosporobacter sp.]